MSCFGFQDGVATIIATGGIAPYTYSWSNGETTSTISALFSGNYSVTVTDSNSCVVTRNILVNQPLPLIIPINATAVSCYNGSNAIATANPNGGTSPYTYLWSNGETTQTATGLSVGNHTVTVTDAVGCPPENATVTITQPNQINATGSITNVSCNSGGDGSITLSVSGGNGDYTYLWSNTQITQTASLLVAGDYTVVITDSSDCLAYFSYTIIEPSTILTASLTITDVSCFNGNDGTATVSVIGGTPPYNYLWPNGISTTTLPNLTAGLYSCTVTDANGCLSFAQGTVSEPVLLTLTQSTTPASCNGFTDGSATAIPQGGTPPFTYNWSNGQSTQTSINLNAGQYSVLVVDSNFCNTSATIIVGEPSQISATLTSFDVQCNGDSTGILTASNVSGTTPPYSYYWSNGHTDPINQNLNAGVYYLTITDGNGCSNTFTGIINEPTVIVAVLSPINITVNGANDGVISTSTLGGVPAYSYSWTGPNNYTNIGPSINNLSMGVYTVTITDSYLCEQSFSQVIAEPSCDVIIDSTYIAPLCYNQMGVLSWVNSGGLPPYTNTLINSNNNIIINGAQYSSPNTPLQLPIGVYDLTVVDAAGCPAILNMPITAPDVLNIELTLTDVSCNGGNNGNASALVTGGTSPYIIDWGLVNPNQLIAGNYNVLVIDDNGCFPPLGAINYSINEPTQLLIDSFASTLVSCTPGNDGTATIFGSGGVLPYSYYWSNGQTTQTAQYLTSGSYIGYLSDANSCTVNSSPAIQISNATPLDVNVQQTPISCTNNSDGILNAILISGSGPITYSWFDLSFPSVVISSDAIVTNLSSGAYSLLATDINGCIDQNNISLGNPIPVTFLLQSTDISSNGANNGVINTVSVSGGLAPFTYYWAGPNGFIAVTSSLNNLGTGQYTLTITDANGCTSVQSAVINEPNCNVAVSDNIIQPVCFGLNGTLSWINTGGVGPYTNILTDLNSNAILYNNNISASLALAEGDYALLIEDQYGCFDLANITILAPDALTGNITITNTSCFGYSDGNISIQPSGGTSPYSYNYGGVNPNALAAGVYQVTLIDANGCSSLPNPLSYQITEPVDISTTITTTTVSCIGGGDGTAIVNVIGGEYPYTYLWSPSGYTSPAISNLSAGIQYVSVTDALGCSPSSGQSFATITEPLLGVSISINPTNTSCYGEEDGMAQAFAIGGTPPYTYLWSNGQTSSQATGLEAGTYNCTINDGNGCTTTQSVTINQPSEIITNVITTDVSCNGFSDGSATINPTGGSGIYSVVWFNNSTSMNIANLITGVYSVSVSDNTGCSTTENPTTFIINQPDELQLSTSLNQNASCFGGADGSVTVSSVGGTLPYSFEWTDSLNNIISTDSVCLNLSAGYYTALVTDVNGCYDTVEISIGSPVQIIPNLTFDSTTCNGLSDGVAYVNPTGGSAPYSYNWSVTGSSTSSSSGLNASTTYFVTIADANGCPPQIFPVNIPEPDAITTTFLVSDYNGYNVSCYDSTNAIVDVSTTGGSSNYIYSTDSLYFTPTTTFANISPGLFTVYTQDLYGCVGVNSINISEPSIIDPNINAINNVTCSGGSDGQIASITSGGTGLGTYLYSWGNLQITDMISGLIEGIYSLTVTDANGCIATASFLLTADIEIFNNPITVPVSCNGSSDGAATMMPYGGSAPYSYVWSIPNNFTANIQGLSAGIYTCTITDDNGCAINDTINIVESDSNLTITNIVITNEVCFGGSQGAIEVTASGGSGGTYIYLWDDINAQTTPIATGLVAGTYTIEITDSTGCTVIDIISVTEPDALLANETVIDISCFGFSDGIINTSTQGGTLPYDVDWIGPNGFNSSFDTLTNLASGIYTLVITDSNECTYNSTLTIIEPDPLLYVLTITDPLCFNNDNGSIELLLSGGVMPYIGEFGAGLGTISYPSNNIIIIDNLSAGTESLIVTDANGCENLTLVNLINPTLLNINLPTLINPSCFDYADGVAAISPTGGTLPYIYALYDANNNLVGVSSTTADISDGNYTYIVTDVNNCTDNVQIQLVEPDEILIIENIINHVECYGANTASILVDVLNTVGNYQIFWNGVSNDSVYIPDLNSGIYEATVIDDNNCVKVESFTVTQNEEIQAEISTQNSTCARAPDGKIFINNLFGGIPPYSIYNNGNLYTEAIYFSSTIESLVSTLNSDPYQVLITDAINCEFTKEVILDFDGGYNCIDVPIIISPNYDGTNDSWQPVLDINTDIEVLILNRWGKVEFNYSGNSVIFEWNGLASDGSKLPTTDYYYIIKFNNNSYPDRTGALTLIR